MANDSRPLFNYYLRYPWGPADFENLQDSLVGITRDSFAELHGAGLLFGGTIAPSGSVSGVTVTALTALNENGYLLVTGETRFVDLADGHATNARIDLIVARPLLSTGAQISRPTSPNDTVALTELQQCQLIAIAGTPAGSPVAPAKVAGDVILAAVTVPALATSIISGNINRTTQEVGKAVRWSPSTRTVTPPTGTTLVGFKATGGSGGANGIEGIGTLTGAGVLGSGGTTDAPGVRGEGGGVDGNGVEGLGYGNGYGGYFEGGAGDTSGVFGQGGDTDGSGVEGQGAGNGAGVKGTGGSDAGDGVLGIAGPGGHGVRGTASDGFATAVRAEHTSTGPAIAAVNSSTGSGITSSTGSGPALEVASASGHALLITQNATKAPFRLGVLSAHPTGPNAVGDMYVFTGGILRVCTAAGSPGTWANCN